MTYMATLGATMMGVKGHTGVVGNRAEQTKRQGQGHSAGCQSGKPFVEGAW